MATPITVPKLGESVTSAILVRWLKQAGDRIERDEPVCELETDKANVDVPATAAGFLRTLKQPGETVAIGDAIAMVEESGAANGTKPAAATAPVAATTASAKESAPAPTAPSSASTIPPEDLSPAVRVLVAENGLDAAALQKAAPGGRLTKEFVQSYLSSSTDGAPGGNGVRDDNPSKNAPPTAKTSTVAQGATQTSPVIPPPAGKGASERVTIDPNAVPKDFDANGERRVKMSKLRVTIAKRLVQAQQTAAILTTFNEVDLTEVMSLRTKYKEAFEKAHGVGLGFMSFFARAVCKGLKEFPRINAYLEGDEIVYHEHVNLGIAVSTERGLLVPVLRNVESMSFGRIESEIKRMAIAARDNKVSIDELSGGTFTITNGGVFGSLLSTPILNPPQSGILGMHAIQKRPVAINDKVEIRPMMYLALSYDHRIVDGKESISFLVRLKQCLEDPARLMLDI